MFGNNKADDNVGAINLCVHPMFRNKSVFIQCSTLDRIQHVAFNYHCICEQVQNRLLCAHISFMNQLADALTKHLHNARFQLLSDKIGLSFPSS